MEIREVPPNDRTDSVLATHRAFSQTGTHEEISRRSLLHARPPLDLIRTRLAT